MQKFRVFFILPEIRDSFARCIEFEAHSIQDALRKAYDLYPERVLKDVAIGEDDEFTRIRIWYY